MSYVLPFVFLTYVASETPDTIKETKKFNFLKPSLFFNDILINSPFDNVDYLFSDNCH